VAGSGVPVAAPQSPEPVVHNNMPAPHHPEQGDLLPRPYGHGAAAATPDTVPHKDDLAG
jgi:hypothetical protein